MEASKPAKAVKKAVKATVEGAAARAAEMLAEREAPPVPGSPGSGTPPLAEPTKPREPLPPKPDQAGPDRRTATGAPTDVPAEAVSGQGRFLTTSQGARLRDSDHSLKAGERGPTLLQDHHLREKITHFDHERIPERVVHARGAGAHGTFIGYGNARSVTKAGFLAKDVETPVFVRFSTVLGSRGSADTVRDTRGFATKFYTDRGHLRPGRQQHPGLLHPGRHQVPRRDPRGQAAPGPGDPAGAERPRHVLGLRVPAHRGAAPHDLEHVRPGHPALLPDDGGLRRPHLPVREQRRRDLAGQVPLEAGPRRALAHLGGGAAARGHRPGLPPARPVRRDRGRCLPAVGARRPGLPGHSGRDVRRHRPARPDEAGPRGARSRPADRAADPDPQPDELLRGDRAGRLPRRQPGARASTSPTTRCCRRGSSPTSTRSSPGSAGPNFHQIPINRPHAPVNDMLRDGFHQDAVHGGVAPYKPNSLDGGCPFFAGGAKDGAFVDVPAHVAEAVKIRANPASYDDHYSQARQFWLSMTAAREGAHRRGVHLRAREVLRAADQGAPAPGAGQHRPGPVRPGGGRARPAGPGADASPWSTSTRAPRCRSSATSGRPTAGSSGSSSTPTVT